MENSREETNLKTRQARNMRRIPAHQVRTVIQGENEVITPIVSFVGNSNSGKTTLLEMVVIELKLKEYRVVVIKHSPHGFDIDQPGKDTWRLTQAGSDIVVVSSPDKVAFIERVDAELTLSQIEALLRGKADMVLTEGYKNGNTAKILVLDDEHDREQFCYQGERLATISTRLSPLGMPEFDYDDVTRIVNLLIGQIGLKNH
jgi:molybdopterin-guanine dinucleotide biosynthesis protein B